MKYKGDKISFKDFVVGTHRLTMRTISWTSASWLDILEDIYIKLSIISYPFKYIFFFNKNINRNYKEWKKGVNKICK